MRDKEGGLGACKLDELVEGVNDLELTSRTNLLVRYEPTELANHAVRHEDCGVAQLLLRLDGAPHALHALVLLLQLLGVDHLA